MYCLMRCRLGETEEAWEAGSQVSMSHPPPACLCFSSRLCFLRIQEVVAEAIKMEGDSFELCSQDKMSLGLEETMAQIDVVPSGVLFVQKNRK